MLFQKYPYPHHGRFSGLSPTHPTLWKFQFRFILSFTNFGFWDSPPPRNFQWPSFNGVGMDILILLSRTLLYVQLTNRITPLRMYLVSIPTLSNSWQSFSNLSGVSLLRILRKQKHYFPVSSELLQFFLVLVVQGIHWIVQLVLTKPIHWIMIYAVDNVIHFLDNWE